MTNTFIKTMLLASVTSSALTTSAFAGGLSDAITEREPEIIAQTTQDAMPGWVLPVVALALIGVVASSSGGGGSDDSDDPTPAGRIILDDDAGK